MDNEYLIDLFNIMTSYEDETVNKAFMLFTRGGSICVDNDKLTPLEEYALEKAYSEYTENEEMKFINEDLTDIFDEARYRLLDEDLIKQTTDLFNELDNYDFNYQIKKTFNMSDTESFDEEKVDEIINSDDIDKLTDYFNELKDNEHLQYLVESSVFNSEHYNNMIDKIIPSLEYIEKNRENDKEFEM